MTTPNTPPPRIPSLDALGDRLQAAVAVDQARSDRSRARRASPAAMWLSATGIFAVLVLAAVLLVGVVPPQQADAVVLDAGRRTVDAGTATFAVQLAPVGVVAEPVLTGRYDLAAEQMSAEVDLVQLLGAVGGEGLGDRIDDRLGRFGTMLGGAQIVVDGSEAYVHSPPLAALLDGVDGWVRFSLDALVADDDGSAIGLVPADAAALLELLGGVDGSVTEVGPETVDGVATVHYQGSVAPEAAVATLQAAAPEGSDGLVGRSARIALDASTSIPFDVWVDDAGHVRRITSTLLRGGDDAIQVTVTYGDIGGELPIVVPDPDVVPEVTDQLVAVLGG